MSDQEKCNPQPGDQQKSAPEQKTGNQPNQPVQEKQHLPGGQPMDEPS